MPPAPTTVTSLCASISERSAAQVRVAAVQQRQFRGQVGQRRRGASIFVAAGVGPGAGARLPPRRAVERGGEPVPAPGDRRDGLRAEQLAQRADLHLQVVLLDHQPRPDRLEQLVLGDEPLAPLDQREQQVERARAQRRRLLVDQELPRRGTELEATESIGGRHGGR